MDITNASSFWNRPVYGVLRTSSRIQVLMNRKDNINLFISFVAVLLTLSVMIFLSFGDYKEFGIPISLILGDLVLLIGLGIHLDGLRFFKQRLSFMFKLIAALIVCYIFKLVVGPSILTLALCVGIYLLWTFFFYRNDSNFVIEN